ncbi:hypothetical protein OG874_00490 [Nocardia sp. NBC_00565]|uniref:hypothetical protein n=1 Tax=Nocardia sp. NBC_00565 TaxID=2975993 RepID=UPI002E812AD4|nr:hypothetical protein [Nocardia sp. NBC_00565]WUC03733.1 hypothetical protein OG874_00490 [Nocardia sp. NBC_00565]
MTASLAKRLLDPAYFTHPEYVQTYGPEVADLSALAGFEPDPEQEMALDVLFALDADGLPLVFEFAVIAPRQNMKSGLLKMAALGWLYITEERLVVWSAHEMQTTKEAFLDLTTLIEDCAPLRKRLAPGPSNGIYRGNGDESIELATKQRMLFRARTHRGGRGLTGDKLILDEAFALQAVHTGAVLPTLAARPRSQVAYGSSAGTAGAAILRGIRDRGRAGGDPSLGYMEYCAPPGGCASDACTHMLGIEGCALDDRENWRVANSALGRRITIAKIAAFRRAEPPIEFAREHMGWWEEPSAAELPLISEDTWRDLRDRESKPNDPVAFGLYLSQDRSVAAIAVAGRRADFKIHIEIVPAQSGNDADSLPGTAWIAPRLAELKEKFNPCAVVIDSFSAAASLIPAITEAGVEVTTTGASDMARACGQFYDAIVEDELRHLGARPLQAAVCSAKKRNLRDAWAWDRTSPNTDITQLVAATLAVHGLIAHGPVEKTETEVWGFWE